MGVKVRKATFGQSNATRQWSAWRDFSAYTTEELRAIIDEGLKSGLSRLADMVEVKAEARRRIGCVAPNV